MPQGDPGRFRFTRNRLIALAIAALSLVALAVLAPELVSQGLEIAADALTE